MVNHKYSPAPHWSEKDRSAASEPKASRSYVQAEYDNISRISVIQANKVNPLIMQTSTRSKLERVIQILLMPVSHHWLLPVFGVALLFIPLVLKP